MSAERALVPERHIAWFVAITFGLTNVYYFHRWTFRYSNDGTSGTYADTPFAWQIGKYLLLGVASAAMWAWVVWCERGRTPWWRVPYQSTGWFAPLLACVTCYSAVIVIVAMRATPDVRELASMFFFVPIVLLIPAVPLTSTSLSIYRTAGLVLIGYHTAFTVVQLVAYVAWDRLPALAYSGGLVRFGGGLDDPNGFAVMVVLPILLSITLWREFRSTWWATGTVVLLAALLFLPLSFSAVAGLVAGLLALAPITRRARLLLRVCAGVVVTAAVLLSSGYVRGVISDKSESARSRFDFGGTADRPGLADFLDDLSLTSFLFGAPGDRVTTENGYVLVFVSFGVIGLGALLALLVICFRSALSTAWRARATGRPTVAGVYEGVSAYIVAFAVASLGVPFFEVVPANMLFWIVATIAAMGPTLVPSRNVPGTMREAPCVTTRGH